MSKLHKGVVRGGMVTIHFSGQTIFRFTHIEGITLGAGEVTEGESGMDVDRIGEVGDMLLIKGWLSSINSRDLQKDFRHIYNRITHDKQDVSD